MSDERQVVCPARIRGGSSAELSSPIAGVGESDSSGQGTHFTQTGARRSIGSHRKCS